MLDSIWPDMLAIMCLNCTLYCRIDIYQWLGSNWTTLETWIYILLKVKLFICNFKNRCTLYCLKVKSKSIIFTEEITEHQLQMEFWVTYLIKLIFILVETLHEVFCYRKNMCTCMIFCWNCTMRSGKNIITIILFNFKSIINTVLINYFKFYYLKHFNS